MRLWLRGETLRGIERLARVDRKTVRRYVEAAVAHGVAREGGEDQLADEVIGSVVEAVRPHRSDGHGEAWRLLVAHHDQIKAWLDKGLTVVKCHDLLTRQGVVVPSGPCTATPWKSAGTAGAGDRRWGWPMVAPAMSARSTSAGWARSTIQPASGRGRLRADLHSLLQPALLRVGQLHPDH